MTTPLPLKLLKCMLSDESMNVEQIRPSLNLRQSSASLSSSQSRALNDTDPDYISTVGTATNIQCFQITAIGWYLISSMSDDCGTSDTVENVVASYISSTKQFTIYTNAYYSSTVVADQAQIQWLPLPISNRLSPDLGVWVYITDMQDAPAPDPAPDPDPAPPTVVFPTGTTDDGTVSITLGADATTWEYSLNSGSTWLTGSGLTFILPDATYPNGSIHVHDMNAAGTISTSIINTDVITITAKQPDPPTVVFPTGPTDDGTVSIILGTGATTWQYSVNGGSKFVDGGSGFTFILSPKTYNVNSIQVHDTDADGNISVRTSNTSEITITAKQPDPPTVVFPTTSPTDDGTVSITLGTDATTWEYSLDNGATWVGGSGLTFILPDATYPKGSIQVRDMDSVGTISASISNTDVITIATVYTNYLITNTQTITVDRNVNGVVFNMVGGGGSGGTGDSYHSTSSRGGNGGNGGQWKIFSHDLTKNTSYNVVIGKGGAKLTSYMDGNPGDSTTITDTSGTFNVETALGGYGGLKGINNVSILAVKSNSKLTQSKLGGFALSKPGADGTKFLDGKMYGGGGGTGMSASYDNNNNKGGLDNAGHGGPGLGGDPVSIRNGKDAVANSGGGGGGGGGTGGQNPIGYGGAGGSGIVMIKLDSKVKVTIT